MRFDRTRRETTIFQGTICFNISRDLSWDSFFRCCSFRSSYTWVYIYTHIYNELPHVRQIAIAANLWSRIKTSCTCFENRRVIEQITYYWNNMRWQFSLPLLYSLANRFVRKPHLFFLICFVRTNVFLVGASPVHSGVWLQRTLGQAREEICEEASEK